MTRITGIVFTLNIFNVIERSYMLYIIKKMGWDGYDKEKKAKIRAIRLVEEEKIE